MIGSALCAHKKRNNTLPKRQGVQLVEKISAPQARIQTESSGFAAVFIKSPALPDFLFQSEQKFRLSELLSRLDVSERMLGTSHSIETVVSIERLFAQILMSSYRRVPMPSFSACSSAACQLVSGCTAWKWSSGSSMWWCSCSSHSRLAGLTGAALTASAHA